MEGTNGNSELDPDASRKSDKLTAGSIDSDLGVPHDDDKARRVVKNKGSSSASSSTISGEHLRSISGEVDRFEESFNKSDPESAGSGSPPEVPVHLPQWSMISVSPRTGSVQSFSTELLQSNSPMKSPPIPQVMGRSAGYDPNRIPSSVFATRPTTPVEWSIASNESLFSIHMGGTNSFSRDHVFMLGDCKLEELTTNSLPLPQNVVVPETKSESNQFVTNLPPLLESTSETDKKSVEVKREEEPPPTPPPPAPLPPQPPSVEPQKSQKISSVTNPDVPVTPNSAARVSNESGTSSAGSFAFPVLENANEGGKNCSLNAIAEKPEEPQTSEASGQPKAASTSAGACWGWFSCLPSCSKCC